MVDAGLWRGGASILMRAVLAAMGDEERRVWSADLCWNPALPDDSSRAGGMVYPPTPYRTPPLDAVKANFERYSMLDARVTFVVGPFAETLATAPICDVAVLRLDTETFETTLDVLEILYPKMSPGGFVIVNDYGQAGRATRRAVDAFREAHHVRATVMDIDGTGAYWRVPARSPAA
jgi:O-methyltransferase